MTLDQFQQLIEDIYYKRDSERGVEGTFMWFAEEVGELAQALRSGDGEGVKAEFADCLAWLSTLASISGVKLQEAAKKYAHGCPSCHKTPCQCPNPKP